VGLGGVVEFEIGESDETTGKDELRACESGRILAEPGLTGRPKKKAAVRERQKERAGEKGIYLFERYLTNIRWQ
jgi:hypothetical protein